MIGRLKGHSELACYLSRTAMSGRDLADLPCRHEQLCREPVRRDLLRSLSYEWVVKGKTDGVSDETVVFLMRKRK